MRTRWLALALLLWLPSLSQAADLLPFVRVRIGPFSDDTSFLGSGTIVSDKGDVLTNRHVAEHCNRGRIPTSADIFDTESKFVETRQITFRSLADRGDLALFRLASGEPPAVCPVAAVDGVPAPGDRVTMWWCRQGLPPHHVYTDVRTPWASNPHSLVLTARVTPWDRYQGMSGSAVLNSKRELVGVLWGCSPPEMRCENLYTVRAYLIKEHVLDADPRDHRELRSPLVPAQPYEPPDRAGREFRTPKPYR